MGTPEFAVPPLEQLVANRFQVDGVYTRPDKLSGRGRRAVAPPLKRAALSLELPVFQPVSLKDGATIAELAALHPDVIVVAAYGQILPPAVLDIPRLGALNLHPSLLPRDRGPSPVAAAILAGDRFTGLSVMLMEPGLDCGPILSQAQIPIFDTDTTATLTDKLSEVAAAMIQEVLMGWSRGELPPRPQDEARASYFGVISKEDGEIDWRLPARDIWRRVRAYHPWPGGFTHWRGKRLRIIAAVPLARVVAAEAGRVVALDEAAFGVQTGEGVLGVLGIQLEGKREMTSEEFFRGQRDFIGAVLPSD
jgi:methionyl-tRNA formyltransferase